MTPAVWPRDDVLSERLMTIDPHSGEITDWHVGDLGSMLSPGDVLVVNDAATLPASLQAVTSAGETLEVRLLATTDSLSWTAVLFGAGDWRTPTEHRPMPPHVRVGETSAFGDSLRAQVQQVGCDAPRRIRLRFDSGIEAIWPAIYRLCKPIQYAYAKEPLPLFQVQTRYASRPWAAELPSAGRPLTWGTLLSARTRGVRVASVTHATGLSSAGDALLDGAMPWPEQFEIPIETIQAVRGASRVIAIGTSVVRALEGCAARHGGSLRAERAETDLVIRPGFVPRIVDGLLTGIHDPTGTHFEMLRAFAADSLLRRAHQHAEDSGYLCHEFGDSCLILSQKRRVRPPA